MNLVKNSMKVKTAKVETLFSVRSKLAVEEVFFWQPLLVELFRLVFLGSVFDARLWYRHSHEGGTLTRLRPRTPENPNYTLNFNPILK